VVVSRVEISDLMEATFWEANKGRIGAAIAVVALGVLGWQGWSRHQDAQRAGEWTALFDENLALRSDLDPKSFAASSPAAPWALLHTARTAFEEKDLARAQSALSDINSLREKVNVPSDLVDRIASDIANETKFSSENQATKSGISDESARLKFKLADADVEVSIFSDAALGEFAAFARSLSAASLTEIRLDQATSGTELSGSMNWTQLRIDGSVQGPGTDVRANQAVRVESRGNHRPSNREPRHGFERKGVFSATCHQPQGSARAGHRFNCRGSVGLGRRTPGAGFDGLHQF
jgi:hypothetical protein